MKRRKFVATAAGLGAALGVGMVGVAHGQAQAPVVKSGAILKALTVDKDVVLDNGARPRPVRDPSISLQVQFDFDSARLRPVGERQLDELARALNDKALVEWGFEFAGHTDRVGDAAYNQQLSSDRAAAVKAYLVANHGVAGHRLQTIGYGFTRLADPGNPTAAVNRRVEVRRIRMVSPSGGGQPRRDGVRLGGRIVPTPQ